MPLFSDLFRGDPKLEACAVQDSAHVAQGARGEHVKKIQTALNLIDAAGLVVDGDYGPATARAVLIYKQKRDIVNRARQSQPDNIVGKMTIASLDKELLFQVDPVVIIGRQVPVEISPRTLFSFSPRRSGAPAPIRGTTLGAVIRGNPYVPQNASASDGMPPSIPPNKNYAVPVTIQPPLTGGNFIEFEIVNGSGINGTAAVAPVHLQRSAILTVTGKTQTTPGNAGQLQIQAKLNGVIKATSGGFSVCAHPLNVRIDRVARDVFDQSGAGMQVVEKIESDSPDFQDMDRVEVSELVEAFKRDDPPFQSGSGFVNNSGFQPVIPPSSDLSQVDTHVEPRPRPGPPGKSVKIQVHMFRCFRCGATDKPVPHSGFEVTHEVFRAGNGFKHRVSKKGEDVGITAPSGVSIKSKPGLGTARSSEHDL
jgi:peptidoglycan hydrolase-like protein with peptidoglycan-binding domain